ncbi:ABC transporter permease subunit [Legionella nagasakiensis]|uniref:ABC transporter permease subunit n=1 Tax=Legionella nagasakiensis TaxID=535290 RepID=UPI0010567C0E|nr:ABC transporter permease subunit [Legionella nagasakiensis]
MTKYTQHSKTALLFIIPQLLVTVLFFIWPACKALWQSLFFSDAFGLHQRFAGLANFIDLLNSREYLKAVSVTLIIAVSVTLLTMSLGLSLAVMVNRRHKGQQLYKSLLLWPYAVAPAVAALLWRFLFHPALGWMTCLLNKFGVDFNYLIHAKQALFVIIMAASWQQFSYNFLFFFAALKLIPSPLIEAAMMDGASSWRIFWQIIFPLLSPTAFFLLTMNLIYAFFDTFGIIQIITNGGPEYSTTTLIYKVYEDGFVAMDPGSSSAQSVILMLIVVGLTLLQFRYLERKVHYQ